MSVRITVRVKPRARRPGVETGSEGLVVRVRAAPEKGRATEEARAAVAAHLGVPAGRIRLARGASSRVKIFEISGLDEESLGRRLGNS